jgi:hypothetical protein
MRKSLPWIFSVLFLVAVYWVVASSSTFQGCIDEEQSNAANQHLQSSASQIILVYRRCVGSFVHNNAEGIIAVFTIVLALSTIFLWSATRDLVHDTQSTAQAQLRAFVFFTTIEASPNHFPDATGGLSIKEYVFWANVENVGLTPALDIRMGIKDDRFPMNENREPNFDWDWGASGTTVLGPHGRAHTGYCVVPLQAMIELWERKTAIFLGMRLEYRDVFDPKTVHHNEQCIRLDLLREPHIVEPPGAKNAPRVVLIAYGPRNTVS